MLGFLPTRAYRPGTPGATTFLSPLSGTFNYGWDSFHDPLQLLTVSRLIERKGIQHLLAAIARLDGQPDVRLLIVGEGNYEEQLKERVEALRLFDRVTFHGYCPRTELPALYNKAEVFALPSMAESFGMVFAEAMACGLPILGGRTGGVPDLIHSMDGILVEPGSVDEIEQAIRKLAGDPELRGSMARANRDRVVENYSWNRVAREYLRTYPGAACPDYPPPTSSSPGTNSDR